jgi:hypothetical protein
VAENRLMDPFALPRTSVLNLSFPRFAERPSCLIHFVAVTLLLGVAADLPAAWADEQSVGPFTCHAEFALAEIQPLLVQLQQLQTDLVQALGIRPVEEPIELYLFRSKGTYDQFLSRNLPKIPYRRALYVKDRGPGRVFAYRGSHFEVDLRHESTHAILHAALPVVPLWLDEGLAAYFENPVEKRVYGSPQWDGVRWSLRLGGVERLESLERKRRIEEMERGDYRAAWAWVHFMLHGSREARDELARFMADLQSSTPPGLLSQRLRQRVGNPAEQLAAHFRSWSR